MPNPNTFNIKPIGEFIKRWKNGVAADPFARNSCLCEYTNDLNPETSAKYNMLADKFMKLLDSKGIKLDCLLFDPPYSPRQISECYQSIGREVTNRDTQNARLYKNVRDASDPLIKTGGIVLSFGWNSGGMGKTRGYKIEEILLVAHGGAHNDTICIAEKKL